MLQGTGLDPGDKKSKKKLLNYLASVLQILLLPSCICPLLVPCRFEITGLHFDFLTHLQYEFWNIIRRETLYSSSLKSLNIILKSFIHKNMCQLGSKTGGVGRLTTHKNSGTYLKQPNNDNKQDLQMSLRWTSLLYCCTIFFLLHYMETRRNIHYNIAMA